MAKKILGKLAPAATTYATLYAVPAAKEAVGNGNVTNRGSSATTFRWAILKTADNASSPPTDSMVYFDEAIGPKQSFEITRGVCLGPDEKIVIYAGNADLSFQFWGDEVDAT